MTEIDREVRKILKLAAALMVSAYLTEAEAVRLARLIIRLSPAGQRRQYYAVRH